MLYKSTVSINPIWQKETTEAQRSWVTCPSLQGVKDKAEDPPFPFSSFISEPGISLHSAAYCWKAEERSPWFLMERPKSGWRRKLKLGSKQGNMMLPFLSILTFMERTVCLLHWRRSGRANSTSDTNCFVIPKILRDCGREWKRLLCSRLGRKIVHKRGLNLIWKTMWSYFC